MTIVSNTTPLIGLASIGRFDLLRQIFGNVIISQAVYREAVVEGYEEGGARRDILASAWITTSPVKDRLAVDVLLDDLDLGEAETIVLAGELKADWVLMDEKKGRRKLAKMGVRHVGTIGILLTAKEKGLIPEVRPEIDHLRGRGFSLSQQVVDALLRQARE